MKRHIYYTVLLALAAWGCTGCSDGYEYFNPNPGDEEQAATTDRQYRQGLRQRHGRNGDDERQLQRHGPDRHRSRILLRTHGGRNDEIRTPIVCTVDAEGRFSHTLSDVDNGDHYFRAYMIIDGQTYNGRHRVVRGEGGLGSGSHHRAVRSRRRRPHAQGQLQTRPRPECGAGIPLRRDRRRRCRPYSSYGPRKSTKRNKTFSLDIPDTGQPCFFQAVVRMSTDFYDGEVSEVIRPKDLSADGRRKLLHRHRRRLVQHRAQTSRRNRRPRVPPPTGYGRQAPDLYRACTSRRAASSSRPAGTPDNAGIALTNDAGEIVWSWHIWMAQAPAEQTCQRPHVPRPQRRRHGVRRGSGRLAGRLLPVGTQGPVHRGQPHPKKLHRRTRRRRVPDNRRQRLHGTLPLQRRPLRRFQVREQGHGHGHERRQSDRFLRSLQLRRTGKAPTAKSKTTGAA